MLNQNHKIKKLYIQHNNLKTEGARLIVNALENHRQIKYLDISANSIGSMGFKYFISLFKANHILRNLHVRKNDIEGTDILDLPHSLAENTHLWYLDMKDNLLNKDFAKSMINMMHENLFLEDIVLLGNNYIG